MSAIPPQMPPHDFRVEDYLTEEEKRVMKSLMDQGRGRAMGYGLMFASIPPLFHILSGRKLSAGSLRSLANANVWREEVIPRLKERQFRLMFQSGLFYFAGTTYGKIKVHLSASKHIRESSLPDSSLLKRAAIENKPFHVVLKESGQLGQMKGKDKDALRHDGNSSDVDTNEATVIQKMFGDTPETFGLNSTRGGREREAFDEDRVGKRKSDYSSSYGPAYGSSYGSRYPSRYSVKDSEDTSGGSASDYSKPRYPSRYPSKYPPRHRGKDSEDIFSEDSAPSDNYQQQKEGFKEEEGVWKI